MSDNKTINTMIEFTKTNRITVGVVAVVVILLLGFLFLKPAEFVFNSSLSKELNDVNNNLYQKSPQLMAQSILSKDNNIILVDVRSDFEFNKGHLPNARNIYTANLFDKDNISFFKELKKTGKTAIFYGATADEANVPFMILKQMGIENIAVSNAGYEVFKGKSLKDIATLTNTYNDELPIIDFAQFISEANKNASPTQLKAANAEKTKELKEKQKTEPKPVETPKGEGC